MAPPRIACIDIPSFPLQLVLRENPSWRHEPAVIVEDDRPLAPIVYVNRSARAYRIQRGMKFSQAKAITSVLHSTILDHGWVHKEAEKLFAELHTFSPRVEPSHLWPGLFWLDPQGLEGIHGSLPAWAGRVHRFLEKRGFVSAVAVGFSRCFTFALARIRLGHYVLNNPAEEKRLSVRVPLGALNISADLRDQMALLGVFTLGEFIKLPASDLRLRYGEEAALLHQMASGKAFTPLQPHELREPITDETSVEPPDADSDRLLFLIKGMVQAMLPQLESRGHALVALQITFTLEYAPYEERRKEGEEAKRVHTRLETASPTLELMQIVDLVRLRLNTLEFGAPVAHLGLVAQSVGVMPRSLSLFQGAAKRDLEAGERSLARLRALFGPQCVTQAQIRDAHLPEAKFRWEPVTSLQAPKSLPRSTELPPLIRRVRPKPLALHPIPQHEPESWLREYGIVDRFIGPSRVSGGWWVRQVDRDYFFIETKTGRILWVYRDQRRRRWFLHGALD